MRQRFAPSPSGFLHLGHAFSALTIWRAVGGDASRFILRIEDIDTARCKPAFETAIMEDLHWLGISWADTPLRQSARAGDYAEAVRDLWQRGLVFACDCNRREAGLVICSPRGRPALSVFIRAAVVVEPTVGFPAISLLIWRCVWTRGSCLIGIIGLWNRAWVRLFSLRAMLWRGLVDVFWRAEILG